MEGNLWHQLYLIVDIFCGSELHGFLPGNAGRNGAMEFGKERDDWTSRTHAWRPSFLAVGP
jgi:hypothetical protein